MIKQSQGVDAIASAYRFASYWLDPARRVLIADGAEVALSENIFQLLLLFVESNGSVVSKRAIADRVWAGQRVSKANLHQHVFMLRQILKERGREHAFILTIPRSGYRFVPQVRAVDRESIPHVPPFMSRRTPETSPHALTYYCNGCIDLDQSAPEALERAAESFRLAIEVDSSYAPAHMALARTYAALGIVSRMAPSIAYTHMQAHVRRAATLGIGAVELAEAEAEAAFYFEWDFVRGRQRLFEAARAGSASPMIRGDVVRYLLCVGDVTSAINEVHAAIEQFPQVSAFRLLLGRALMSAGHYDHAAAVFAIVERYHPHHDTARTYLAACRMALDEPSSALSLMNARAEVTEADLPLIARLHAALGNGGEALASYEALLQASSARFVSAYDRALVECALERSDDALASLRRAFRERDPRVLFMRGSDAARWFAPLVNAPEYQNLLTRLPTGTEGVAIRSA